MSRKSNRNRRQNASKAAAPKPTGNWKTWGQRLIAIMTAFGLLTSIPLLAYHYVTGTLSLEFVGQAGRGYAFALKNSAPTEKVIKSFRISLPNQKYAYTITAPVYGKQNSDGSVTLPGGNLFYVPAVEFNELDGQKIEGNASRSFTIPPLTSRSYTEPKALTVYVRYDWESSNIALRTFERLAAKMGFEAQQNTIQYMVENNYWNVSPTADPKETLRSLCRDDDLAAKSEICAGIQ